LLIHKILLFIRISFRIIQTKDKIFLYSDHLVLERLCFILNYYKNYQLIITHIVKFISQVRQLKKVFRISLKIVLIKDLENLNLELYQIKN
jgi:hypothetical protein